MALLDSGTAAVPGLTAPGKLSYGPDLSIESNGVLTDQDSYGHGTHLAGIIAANDGAPLTASNIASLSPSTQLGVAPDADLLSMKLANTDGSTDVSQVIAALNWVTEHQTAPDGSRIRVVNLSYGTDSVQPYQLDPLAAAAENAWRHGLVVVVSGGNAGPDAGHLDDPAIDPYVLAVGASDSNDLLGGWALPNVASFSSSGSDTRHVDLLAPGILDRLAARPRLLRRREPPRGPGGRRHLRPAVPRQRHQPGRRGGLRRRRPAAAGLSDPDPGPGQGRAGAVGHPVLPSPRNAGAGELNVAAALAAAKRLATPCTSLLCRLTTPDVTQRFPISTGQGSLEAARAGSNLVDADGVPLTGEVDVLGNPWNAAGLVGAGLHADLLVRWPLAGRPVDRRRLAAVLGPAASARWASARWASARWADADWAPTGLRPLGLGPLGLRTVGIGRWASARWADSDWD